MKQINIQAYWFLFILIVTFPITIALHAQPTRGIQWAKDGNSYFAQEGNKIVRYQLPSFQNTIVVDSAALIPKGQTTPLRIRTFSLSRDEKKVLIYTNTKRVWRLDTRGDYWVLDRPNNRLKQLGKGRPASSLMFAKIAPDGKKAAYVSGHNLYVEDLTTGKVTRLTQDGTDRLINGTFDWVYEEEFDCRDGFRWSEDSKSIAYWQVDARKIKNFLLINNTDSLYSFTIPVEYPKAGEDPSPCKVGVVDIATGQTKWMQIPGDPRQHYLPRMEWGAGSTELIVEQLNRKQNEAKLFLCNARTGAARAVYSEKDKAWIDAKANAVGWEWINKGRAFLWVSEKDGWRHIYRVDRSGRETLLTRGNYDIISLEGIDESSGYVYFMASPDNATQQYLYRVPLSGSGQLERLSPATQKGTHSYTLAPDCRYAYHSFSNIQNERSSEWVQLPGHQTFQVNNTSMSSRSGSLPAVELFQITTGDNITMDGWMILPKGFDSTKKYPVVFTVYAEPAGAMVKDAAGSAGANLYAGDMAADGYILISLDGRGTPVPKGAAWRKAIYRNIGIINIRDQAMAARQILKWPFVDTSRVAVFGWSGGGSTTLNLLFQYPEIYKTGIAIAPVPNQLLYDNIYQERYMGLPQENREDYLKGSPVTHAKNLQGNLLIIHGTGDDNVHYQGTEMLINELVKQGKQFQMMSYPNRTHGIREGEGTYRHLSQLFTVYLKEHCPGGGR